MKIKNITTLCLIVAVITTISSVKAQTKYIDKKGKITFEASEELFEPVKATNESVTVILNIETNEIASLALMKSFRFKNSLMEEHFNENYIESETYPKAIFKGKLLDFKFSDLTENDIEVTVDGKIELRGKEKQIRTTLKTKKSDDSIIIQGSFIVTPDDFDIEIPGIVKNKIAKEIMVYLDFKLSQK
ncbi:YceI family protein [Flaviramulus sp. BrNp1-15]|uniref:YceI family protein n=1 Tax=Flaviramulus sp. BrNp1-15 TaxID=2916754 RepID=UPI001EE7F87B|nr:YceI family protein [Flaviramulus sp. BrNp1-15]ULC59872.1 YceI family protein [Flaviramulus sp. BrNp1-15]